MGLFPKAENFVQDIVVHGCAKPWFVYVKTFVPAFIKLFLTLTIWQLDDLIRSHAKRKVYTKVGSSGRGYGHRRKVRITQQQVVSHKVYTQGLKTVLVITQPLEYIGFAWLLYSASETFFYDWQLLLERSIYCSDTGLAGPFQRSRPGGTNIGVLPEGAITPLPSLEQNRAQWTNTTISVNLPPGFYQVFFAVEVEGPLGGITNVRARLRVTETITRFIESEAASIEQGQTASLLAEGHVTMVFGGTVVWELAGPAVPVGLACTGGNVIVTARDIGA